MPTMCATHFKSGQNLPRCLGVHSSAVGWEEEPEIRTATSQKYLLALLADLKYPST